MLQLTRSCSLLFSARTLLLLENGTKDTAAESRTRNFALLSNIFGCKCRSFSLFSIEIIHERQVVSQFRKSGFKRSEEDSSLSLM
jgi:hypothetical protein